ncbi:hypothetical protein M407DRAFT_27810 [Tulasnella calospora MUT 4182]|uniref:Uncharacterized protein n=1 Tax=Tulasnella calospora MUT 4182 TaxID=1051891 RepID=A0A0C3LMY3_9AGAM|nr:hypothetical protein M407DRAFT_27810 [Tulasnella calospora MUT 4182]
MILLNGRSGEVSRGGVANSSAEEHQGSGRFDKATRLPPHDADFNVANIDWTYVDWLASSVNVTRASNGATYRGPYGIAGPQSAKAWMWRWRRPVGAPSPNSAITADTSVVITETNGPTTLETTFSGHPFSGLSPSFDDCPLPVEIRPKPSASKASSSSDAECAYMLKRAPEWR